MVASRSAFKSESRATSKAKARAKQVVLLKPEVFGRTLTPPKSGKRIRDLCRSGRIPEAVKPGTEWLVPEGALITGKGQHFEYRSVQEGLSVTEYARMHGRSVSRVYKLLKQHRIEGAEHTEYGWAIPEDSPWPADDGF
jgi:hypothetical protein